MSMTEDDKRNCCLLEIQETEAKYYRTLEDIEKVRAGGGCRKTAAATVVTAGPPIPWECIPEAGPQGLSDRRRRSGGPPSSASRYPLPKRRVPSPLLCNP